MKLVIFIVLSTLAAISFAQRSPYAGRNPVGYPEMESATQAEELDNRFGDDATVTSTTERLPIEANGDRNLVNRLMKLPLDQRPFWLLNWLALEDLRKNPQTYEQLPNSFIDTVPSRPSQ